MGGKSAGMGMGAGGGGAPGLGAALMGTGFDPEGIRRQNLFTAIGGPAWGPGTGAAGAASVPTPRVRPAGPGGGGGGGGGRMTLPARRPSMADVFTPVTDPLLGRDPLTGRQSSYGEGVPAIGRFPGDTSQFLGNRVTTYGDEIADDPNAYPGRSDPRNKKKDRYSVRGY